jgi:hypothetical protein
VDDEISNDPWPLAGADEPPGTPGVATHPPFPGVGSDGGVNDGGVSDGGVSDGGVSDGGVRAGGVGSEGGVRAGGVSDGGVRAGGVGSEGGVSDDPFIVTEPPPDALFPPAEPEPLTLPPEVDPVAFKETWPPPGSDADEGKAEAPCVDPGEAPLSRTPTTAAAPPAAKASAAAAPTRPKSRLGRRGSPSVAASRSFVVIVAPSGCRNSALGPQLGSAAARRGCLPSVGPLGNGQTALTFRPSVQVPLSR